MASLDMQCIWCVCVYFKDRVLGFLMLLIMNNDFQVQTRRKAVNTLWQTFNRRKLKWKNKLHMAVD